MRLDEGGRQALRGELEQLCSLANLADDGISRVDEEILEVIAVP